MTKGISMNDKGHKILLVDDDLTLCELLKEYLSGEGFHVDMLHHGQAVIDTFIKDNALKDKENNGPYDVMVLDIMMPYVSGIEVLQAVRAKSNLPIIMLTGRGDDIDRIVGLELGADDYLGKPCNPRELAARIRAILRRVSAQHHHSDEKQFPLPSSSITLHGLHLSPGQRTVEMDNKPLNLTSAEFNVLAILMQSAGDVVNKSSLTEKVLQRKLTAYDRSIDVHVSRVRQKIIQAGGERDLIKTIRGVGYQFLSEDV